MQTKVFKFIFIFVFIISANYLRAQEESANLNTEKTINEEIQEQLAPVTIHGQFKSMHLWRGLAVTNSVVLDVDAGISTKNGILKGGVWGGYGTNGVYREFDYYVIFSPLKNLSFAVWDINNYSTNATWANTDFFDYNADTTGRFIDASVSYTISDKVPLNLYWATVIHGRDRGISNEKNLYSTYVQASYPVIDKKFATVSLLAAGAFALSPEKGAGDRNFYGPKSGFANLGFIVSKTLILGRYELPVSATASWSPINDSGNIQIAVDLF